MEHKWYSNQLTPQMVEKMEYRYALIDESTFVLTDWQELALSLGLTYDNGSHTGWYMCNLDDIKTLLILTETREISHLEGKVIEAYVDLGGPVNMLRGISVNKNLISHNY